jgi:hypothetical protein
VPRSSNQMTDPAVWPDRETYATFCGDRTKRLLAHYDKAVARRNPMASSLNWLAMLLFPAWCGYRRQWHIWGIYVGALVLLGLVEALVGIAVPAGAVAGAGIAAGMMANGFLLTSAINRHATLTEQGLAPEAIQDQLRDRAAPSVPGAILGLVGGVVAIGIGYVVIDVTLGLPA